MRTDFADDWYFPAYKWESAEIEHIDNATVTLVYHPLDPDGQDEERTVTRADMEHMLGWDLTAEDVTIEPGDSVD
mgnify:FL=1